MQVREAKDFLVAQTVEQAALDGVPLSDLEKRMMYFTEGPGAPEDPIKLNEEFEKELDSAEYEAKISRLLHHAYRRLRKENDQARRNWDGAIKCLRRGDHYLLVMWDLASSAWTPVSDSLKLFTAGLAIAALMILSKSTAVKLEAPWHVLFKIVITIIIAGFFFPRRVRSAASWILGGKFFRFFRP